MASVGQDQTFLRPALPLIPPNVPTLARTILWNIVEVTLPYLYTL